jgi:hypothetical protein
MNEKCQKTAAGLQTKTKDSKMNYWHSIITDVNTDAQQKVPPHAFQLPPVNCVQPSAALGINVVKVLEDSDYTYARYGYLAQPQPQLIRAERKKI